MSASPEDAVLELEDPQMAILVLVFPFCGCLKGIQCRK
jgi:hypothetical protein